MRVMTGTKRLQKQLQWPIGEVQGRESGGKSLKSGAADRDRTGTTVAHREILSLLRLPVPPQRHGCVEINRIE